MTDREEWKRNHFIQHYGTEGTVGEMASRVDAAYDRARDEAALATPPVPPEKEEEYTEEDDEDEEYEDEEFDDEEE